MSHFIRAILFDSGDTIVDEGTQVFDARGIVQSAGLIPGAADTLRALKSLGYPVGLVADGHLESFQNVLGHHGLLELFDARSISEQVGVEKPDARMFRCALDELGISPEAYGQVLMVGNHLARDIKGANDLGLVSVWLDWAPRRPKIPADPSEQPRYTIKTPADLLPLITSIEKHIALNSPSRQE